MFLFSNQPGVVGAMVTGGAMPFSIVIGGNDRVPLFPSPSIVKSILTGFRLQKKSGFGLSHTLQERIYAHVFGAKAAPATVSGFAFAGMCSTAGNHVGFDAIHAYYEAVNVSRNGAPVRLVFGPRTALFGMMTDLDFTVEDPSTGLGSFQFVFTVFPRGPSAFPLWELLGGESVLVADDELGDLADETFG